MNQATRTSLPDSRVGRSRVPDWGRQAILASLFYGLYTVSRDVQGSATVSYRRALMNASRIVGLERDIGIFHEHSLQQALPTTKIEGNVPSGAQTASAGTPGDR